MPEIPRSQRTVGTQGAPLPFHSSNSGAAIGRALSGLGNALSGAASAWEKEQQKADQFKFQADLQRHLADQEQKFESYRNEYQGDGGTFQNDVLKGFDNDWKEFEKNVPQSQRDKAQVYRERFRARFQDRSFGEQTAIRSRWYVNQGTDLFARTILPRVTGEYGSVRAGLQATENIIGSMSGVPQKFQDKLREHAAKEIFKRWLGQAGEGAGDQVKALIGRYRASQMPEEFGDLPPNAEKTPQKTKPQQPSGPMPDFRGQRGAAPIRFNNPSGMYPGPSARKFGSVGTEIIGGGHKIAVFPSAVHGAAAQFDLLTNKYAGKRLDQLVRVWGGGNSPGAYAAGMAKRLGISTSTVITREMLADPEFGIKFAKAQAQHEAGRAYPMSDDQWRQAHAMAYGGQAATSAAVAQYQRRPVTTADLFERLVIENAPRIERAELTIQRRAEEAAARKERLILDQTQREGYGLMFDKKLTREWIEANKENLSTSAYTTLMKVVVPTGRTTDPETFSHLLERADERPKEIMNEAAEAYARGDLNYDSYRVIATKARKALDPGAQDAAPPWVREQRSLIKQQLRPPRGASRAQYESYGKALESFDDYVGRQGKEIDRKALREWSQGLVEQTKKGLVDKSRTALGMPRFSQVGRSAMSVEELDETIKRTIRAYREKRLSRDEFLSESKLLQKWRKVIEDQHASEGKPMPKPQHKQPQGGVGGFAIPGIKPISNTGVEAELQPMMFSPDQIGGAMQSIGIDPADIFEQLGIET